MVFEFISLQMLQRHILFSINSKLSNSTQGRFLFHLNLSQLGIELTLKYILYKWSSHEQHTHPKYTEELSSSKFNDYHYLGSPTDYRRINLQRRLIQKHNTVFCQPNFDKNIILLQNCIEDDMVRRNWQNMQRFS